MSPSLVDHKIVRGTSVPESAIRESAVQEARAAAAGAEPAASEYERRLDAAYAEYMTRLAAGEELDEEAFCRRYAAVRSSLARLISAHRFLEANPRLLGDDPEPCDTAPRWPAAGEQFEGFELLRELGRGAFSRVFLARQTALGGRLVAVKITPHANYEAAALGRVEHPNIVPVHSVHQTQDGGLSVVCMPYRGRVTLHEAIDGLASDRPLPHGDAFLDVCRDPALPAPSAPRRLRKARYCDAVRWVAAQLADALVYLHERGTSHRDLKPSNILLQPDGTPLLLDFNLSDNRETPNACLGGTPAYMAPEQIRAMKDKRPGTLDGKADVFALGVILYEWLTGRLPFGPAPATLADTALHDLIVRQRSGPFSLARQRPDVDACLAQLIERCLAFDPDQRPSARELSKSLRGQLQPHRRLARAAARRPRRVLAVGVALLAAVFSAVAYGLTRPSADVRAYQDGVTAFHEGRFEEAEDCFNRAVLARPNEAPYRYARARTWQQLCDVKREYAGLAAAEYDAAQKLSPDPRNAAGAGYCLHRLQNPAVARYYYEKAIAGGYTSAALLNNLACCCMHLAAANQAEEHLKEALKLEPKLVPAHWNMATTQKYLWGPLIIKSPQERAANPLFRKTLATAKHHFARAIELQDRPPAEMLAHAAHAHALGVLIDPRDADAAMELAQRAMDAGMSRETLLKDQFLRQVLLDHPRFPEFSQRRTGVPTAKLSRLLDPLAGL